VNVYEQYYVYAYVDEYENIVYVGKGTASRAWYTRENKGSDRRCKRTPKADWYDEQLALGRLPGDWVRILSRGLSNEEALAMEKDLIKKYKPLLNIRSNPNVASHARKVTDEDLGKMRALRIAGHSWSTIGKATGYHAMTAWRAVNVGLGGSL
jgi:hypothetical protein